MSASPVVQGGSRPVLTGTAVRLVGCDAATVRRAAARGEIPGACRLGARGAWRLTEDALREWARTAHHVEENP